MAGIECKKSIEWQLWILNKKNTFFLSPFIPLVPFSRVLYIFPFFFWSRRPSFSRVRVGRGGVKPASLSLFFFSYRFFFHTYILQFSRHLVFSYKHLFFSSHLYLLPSTSHTKLSLGAGLGRLARLTLSLSFARVVCWLSRGRF